MCGALSALRCLIFRFPPALKTLTTFSSSPHLSLKSPTVKHDSPNLHRITPLFSAPVSEMKAFLCRQTSVSPFSVPGPGLCCSS